MLTSSHSVKVVHFKKNSEEITSVGIILRREKNYELGKIGKRIKALRIAKGCTQVGLAQEIFVNNSEISRWENGKTHPDLKTLKMLSDLFGVSLGYIVGHSEKTDNDEVVDLSGLTLEQRRAIKSLVESINRDNFLGLQ